MSRASRVTARARRWVMRSATKGFLSVVVVPQLLHRNRRRCHSRVTGRPETGRSATLTVRVACTRAVLNPQSAQRITLEMATTATTSRSGRSSTTSSTRMARRCSRIVIASSAATGSSF